MRKALPKLSFHFPIVLRKSRCPYENLTQNKVEDLKGYASVHGGSPPLM